MTFVAGSRDDRFGAVGAQRVEDHLRQRHWYVTRLHAIRNADGIGAPMLMGAACNLILPDLQVIDPRRLGQPFYVEVKTKARQGYYANGGYHTHGIDAPNWRQYRRVQLTTGLPVWLLVLEDVSGRLMGLQVHRTDPDHECGACPPFPKGGVFWRLSQFLPIAQLERRQRELPL